jgi:S-DNA-T family DNA segregation ATPase FtsK/SpoIIIE
MLEVVVPALILMAALTPSVSNDKRKIKTIFENTGYGIRSKKGELEIPRFKKKIPIMEGEEQIGMRYSYTIPLGLPATKIADMEKSVGFFSDGLNRPVIVEYRRSLHKDLSKYLTISVYNKDLPDLYPYRKVPEREGWVIPLGRTLEETLWHDFEKIPHMTVAGTTRFGKTVFLKVLTTYLIEHHPDDVEFYIIDLKGGLEFNRYKNLKQVKFVAKDPGEAVILLQYIHKQLEEDYELFGRNFWTNVSNTPIKRRRFIIVDEAAQLAPEKWMKKEEKDLLGACQWLLGEITRIGGGLGYREVYCTQYPTADTLPRSIKQNSDSKITFRLPSGYASEVAIDERGAEELPSDIKGRALYKTHELKKMQVPLIEDKEMWERLSQYENTSNGEEETTAGGDPIIVRRDGVCDEGTVAAKTQPRKRQKRAQNSKQHEGIPQRPVNGRSEHLLPKRKGKGIGRE